MLTGKRCFEGDTVSDVLASVLRQDPDWAALPSDTPSSVRLLLRRCLERDRKKRLRDIGDAWLEGVAETLAAATPASATPRRSWIAGTVAVLLALGAGFAAARWTTRAPAGTTPIATHSVVPLPAGTRLSGWASPGSPSLATAARWPSWPKGSEPQRLWVHRLDLDESRSFRQRRGRGTLLFSGRAVDRFCRERLAGGIGREGELKGELRKYSLSTGLTQTVASIPDYHGGSWAEDGSLVVAVSTTQGLWRIPAGGGKPDVSAEKVIWQGREDRTPLSWPQVLAGGGALVTFDGTTRWGGAALLDFPTRTLERLAGDTSFSRYAADGRLLMLRRDRSVLAAPFDAQTHRTTGPAVAVLREVATSANGAGALAVSDNGPWSMHPATSAEALRAEAAGPHEREGGRGVPPFEPETFGRLPQISPDGRTLSVMTADESVFLYDLARARSQPSPDRKSAGPRVFGHWSPDGENLTFAA